jgi:hypothetical protein
MEEQDGERSSGARGRRKSLQTDKAAPADPGPGRRLHACLAPTASHAMRHRPSSRLMARLALLRALRFVRVSASRTVSPRFGCPQRLRRGDVPRAGPASRSLSPVTPCPCFSSFAPTNGATRAPLSQAPSRSVRPPRPRSLERRSDKEPRRQALSPAPAAPAYPPPTDPRPG